jgi:hypothetical protein
MRSYLNNREYKVALIDLIIIRIALVKCNSRAPVDHETCSERKRSCWKVYFYDYLLIYYYK